MAKKDFRFKGLTLEEVQKLTIKEFAELIPSAQRRKIRRGFTDEEKKFLKKVESDSKNLETHCREMIIFPSFIGKTIKVYNGKEFFPIIIQNEMIGHVLGEFSHTRRSVHHNAPGIGATRSSASVAVK